MIYKSRVISFIGISININLCESFPIQNDKWFAVWKSMRIVLTVHFLHKYYLTKSFLLSKVEFQREVCGNSQKQERIIEMISLTDNNNN